MELVQEVLDNDRKYIVYLLNNKKASLGKDRLKFRDVVNDIVLNEMNVVSKVASLDYKLHDGSRTIADGV